jgi:putative SOS response-associated peptidase YedK
MTNAAGNLESGNVYPDQAAPTVRDVDGTRTLTKARWGMPSSRKALLDATAKRAYCRVKDAPLVAVAAIATDVVLEAFHNHFGQPWSQPRAAVALHGRSFQKRSEQLKSKLGLRPPETAVHGHVLSVFSGDGQGTWACP